MISDAALREFQEIWREEIGTEISDEKAMEEATQLLTLFDAVYRPIKKAWADEYDNDWEILDIPSPDISEEESDQLQDFVNENCKL